MHDSYNALRKGTGRDVRFIPCRLKDCKNTLILFFLTCLFPIVQSVYPLSKVFFKEWIKNRQLMITLFNSCLTIGWLIWVFIYLINMSRSSFFSLLDADFLNYMVALQSKGGWHLDSNKKRDWNLKSMHYWSSDYCRRKLTRRQRKMLVHSLLSQFTPSYHCCRAGNLTNIYIWSLIIDNMHKEVGLLISSNRDKIHAWSLD